MPLLLPGLDMFPHFISLQHYCVARWKESWKKHGKNHENENFHCKDSYMCVYVYVCGCVSISIDRYRAGFAMTLLRLVQSEGFLAKLSRIQSSAGNLYTRRCNSFQLVGSAGNPGLVVSYPGCAPGPERSSSLKRMQNESAIVATSMHSDWGWCCQEGGLELTRPGNDCSFVAATAALAALVSVRHCADESAQPNEALCASVCVCVCEALCACVWRV